MTCVLLANAILYRWVWCVQVGYMGTPDRFSHLQISMGCDRGQP